MTAADHAPGPGPGPGPRSRSGPASVSEPEPLPKPTPWHEARRIAHAAAVPLAPIRMPLESAAGRVLADDLHALLEVPHYDSSAMDGWAVAGDPPWRLIGAAAGPSPLRAGEACAIVTGGLVPAGARGVLRSEHGRLVGDDGTPVGDDGMLVGDDGMPVGDDGAPRPGGGERMLEPRPEAADEPQPGQHIRLAGREAHAGDRLIEAGCRLNPVHLALAAAGGHDDLRVTARPEVALLLTGEEVVTEGLPAPGRVRDSFGPSLPGVIASLGGTVIAVDRIGDDFDATVAALTACASATAPQTRPSPRSAPHLLAPPIALPSSPAQPLSAASPAPAPPLIVTTGGTGGSGSDQVRAALRALGAEFLIDGLAVRPGGPALLARLPGGALVVGLPGNPLAALLSLLTLAHPVLAAVQGLPLPALGEAVSGADIDPVRTPTLLRLYRLRDGLAVPREWHGSGMLRGLADADGVLVCPGTGAAAGDRLPALPIPW